MTTLPIPTSWLLARLEHDTRDCHAAAEADRFRVLDDPTPAGYRRYLAAMYQLEYSVEARLVYIPDLPIAFVADSMRTGALGEDLLALGTSGGTMAIFARSIELPPLRDAHEALGWMYVMQRNTLQHAQVYRALAPRLRGTLHLASRYLTAHASRVYERWHELGRHLDRAATAPEHATAIVDSARAAFDHQRRWFATAHAAKPDELALA
ncbi:MAG TPA: biliverdin-producing heme oxygenase [Kofleriaceae bacterium]|jgi:heme oxygenase